MNAAGVPATLARERGTEREDAAGTAPPASVVVEAVGAEGHRAAFVVGNPPTAEDVRRLVALGSMPGLRGAEWAATPGASLR
ncbi:MAG: hypothetical protein LC798_20175 [Chloroflexi bacterium]|nr:hypothetical protein [Chloroflexota bacterium]